MQVFAGHTAAVQCGDFTPDGKRILTADADGNLMYWDPRSSTPVFKLSSTDARFDVMGITSLAVNPASTLAVVGGVDGGVRCNPSTRPAQAQARTRPYILLILRNLYRHRITATTPITFLQSSNRTQVLLPVF